MLAPPFSRTSSPFGEWPQWRKNMGLGPHRGLDFVCDEGDPIRASGLGVVVGSGYQSAIGYFLIVRYSTSRGEVYFGYCHLLELPGLNYGDWVARGDIIAHVGNTGTATTGAHLHLTAAWSAGNPAYVAVIDPAPFFEWSTTASEDRTPVLTPEQIEEAELMAAKDDIMAHITQAMEVTRREERPRLFKNATTGQLMLTKITTGFLIGPWDPKEDGGKAESLIVNGYQLLTRQEFDRVMVVDQLRWDNILGEIERHRRALAKAVAEELVAQGLVKAAEETNE